MEKQRSNNQNVSIQSITDLDSLPFPARHQTDICKYIPPPGNYYSLPSTGIYRHYVAWTTRIRYYNRYLQNF